MSSIKAFSSRVLDEWLPSFCAARDVSIAPEEFISHYLSKVSEHDAYWFLRAMDAGYVVEKDGSFLSELSKAKEQIFWAGGKSENPRKVRLWLEPVITVGAFARIVEEFGWPDSQIGLQSKYPWPFDLMGYGSDHSSELLACEVKKSVHEIDKLIELMLEYSSQPPLPEEPDNQTERNAYRKVSGIRRTWPSVFWALGPDGYSRVFAVSQRAEGGVFSLIKADEKELAFARLNHGKYGA